MIFHLSGSDVHVILYISEHGRLHVVPPVAVPPPTTHKFGPLTLSRLDEPENFFVLLCVDL